MVTTVIDQSRLEAFMGQVVVDLAASFSATRVRLGARLGLYRALAEGGSATPGELAERTGTESRMVREWLGNQAAGGYVTYDTASERYTLPPEQAAALADDKSDLYLLGACDILASLFADEDRLGRLASGLAGVVEKLEAGARVADVGCGHGASTIIMAEALPASTFVGFDSRAGGIEPARVAAAEAGVEDRVQFEVAPRRQEIARRSNSRACCALKRRALLATSAHEPTARLDDRASSVPQSRAPPSQDPRFACASEGEA